MENSELPRRTTSKLSLAIDLRLITIFLLITVGVMLGIWRPWTSKNQTTDRTVTVTGQAKLTAEPDEYVFYPSYKLTSGDSSSTLSQLTKKSDEIVAKLKVLGVTDSKIKTNANSYDDNYYYPMYDTETDTKTATLSITITVGKKDLAQKVQDYLLTTTPTGSITPHATFSDDKRKELENKARDEATKDARSKADQSAKNLGFKVGKVKSVSDSNGFGGPIAYSTMAADSAASESSSTKLSIQSGENDLSYSVSVVYYVK